ncbi:cellulase family glycosylhydrolase [Streptomyces sp. NPDC050560]|uniref:cellulase family glycosylhydrolase n=1 Tax=Streptomyces sp. NPDC050560 TaxID=3365630 RepID=UPI0037885D37
MTHPSRRRALGALAAMTGLAATGLGHSAEASPRTAARRTARKTAATGLHVADGRLREADGNDLVLRGVSVAHAWYRDRTAQSLADVKSLGANSVRLVLSSGAQWTRTTASEITDLVAEARSNRLISILEVHDTTGYGEDANAVPLAEAVAYWASVAGALRGQEDYTLVNIGNEPYGNTGTAGWVQDTQAAIATVRDAGIGQALVVDAPCWGQDWDHTMRDAAPAVLAADPQADTVFSVHMYGVYNNAQSVADYLDSYVQRELPVIVGEFGDMHSDGDPDEDAIMSTAQRSGLGYLGWSWSGNGGGVEYLDMATDFDATRLTPWGRRIFDGQDGIASTAQEARVFS